MFSHTLAVFDGKSDTNLSSSLDSASLNVEISCIRRHRPSQTFRLTHLESASLQIRSMASVFLYTPSHVLPAVFAALSGLSCAIHVYQNSYVQRGLAEAVADSSHSRYHYWKLTLWMVWAGIVFTVGWIIRCINSYYTDNLNLYITQTVLIYAGPPIYAVAEYHVLGRLLGYLPYHSPLNPRFTFIVFIYASAAMETLIAAGASTLGAAHGDIHNIILGGTLISIALVLQAAVELLFFALVVLVHVRCWRDSVLPKNVRTLIYMLYGTSLLVLLRCILRAIGSFATTTVTHCNYSVCQVVLYHEWYLYAFEAGPMIIYTYWVNLVGFQTSASHMLLTLARYIPADFCQSRPTVTLTSMEVPSGWVRAGSTSVANGQQLPIHWTLEGSSVAG